MWWNDLLWGFWNGLTAWVVFIVHLFGGWDRYSIYDSAREGGWYDFGFLVGAGSPLLGTFGGAEAQLRARRFSRRVRSGAGMRQHDGTVAELIYGVSGCNEAAIARPYA